VNAILGAHTRVHIITDYNRVRYYLTKTETARREDTKALYIKGFWNDDPQLSTAFAYETACLIRRRLKEESGIATRISFTAGNAAELIDEA
jgi:DNA-dependent RNA polymerase auxiliary subunit epsilon